MKNKFFAEQTLINLFRHRNPTLTLHEEPKIIEKLEKVQIKEIAIPQLHHNGLQDVVEYKKSLESRMNEADIIEKEERVLLEKKIEELHKVFNNIIIGKRNKGKDIRRTI